MKTTNYVSRLIARVRRDLVRNRTKVFCIGWQKTGSTSIGKALQILHFKVDTWDFKRAEWLDDLRRDDHRKIISRMRRFDAAEDNPFPLIFRSLVASFPDAKFILTIRSSKSWYGSALNHWGSYSSPILSFLYGTASACPEGNKDAWIARYERHNAEVLEYFSSDPVLKDKLLVMDLTEGDGWEKLCHFLEKEMPGVPFPHANRRQERNLGANRNYTKVPQRQQGP